MSRMVRNSSAFFIWTCKRDDIDFKFLRKDQIVNHYCRAYSFTTKVGLCTNLKKLPWFENVHPDTFFPRCHKLNSDEEKEDFIDDYRLNATIGLLNWVIEHHGPKTEKQTTSEANNTTDSSPDDKNSSGAKANKKGKTEEGGVVPGDAVALALRACEVHLKCTQHEDIDTDMNFLTEQEWDILITYYYKVILQNGSIESSYKYLSQCQEMHQMMTELLPQLDMGGSKNVWILKPGAKSRGRGITCLNKLEDILKVVGSSNVGKREGKWVIQKYIEHPLLVYNTKFDIRQWFLVTDWNPLTLWFYQDCYIRFCGQQYTLDDFNVSIHLSNNSVQKYYQNGKRDERLPDDNMWSSEDFRTYLKKQGLVHKWDDIVYPGMKQAVMHVLECCQDTLEYRKNSFELYGADFMICDNFKPWLIEINCSPAMGPSTPITKRLCAQVIEDTMKVVLDRKDDKSCDTGRFELAYKQEKVNVPPYIGVNLQVDGLSIQRPPTIIKRPVTSPRTTRPLRNKELTMLQNSNINVLPNIEEKAATTFVEPALFKQPRNIPEGAWAALASDSRSVSAVSFYNIQKEKRKVHQKPQNPYQLSRTVSTDNMRQPKKVPIAYPSRAVMTLHKSILKYRDSTRRLPTQHRLPIALAPGNGIIKAP